MYLLLILLITITSCSWITNKTKQNPPTDKNMVCANIEHNMTFTTDPTNQSADWSSPTKQAELLRQYNKYNCGQANKKPATG